MANFPKKKKTEDTSEEEEVVITKGGSNLATLKGAMKAVFKDRDPTITVDPATLRQSMPTISSGSFVLDYQIGGKPNKYGVSPCPGLPKGRLIQLYGKESCGKTTLALEASAKVCKAGGTVLYIDWEHAVDLAYAESLGVPVYDEDHFLFLQPQTLEDGFKAAWLAAGGANTKKVKLNVDLIVFDSIGAGVPEVAQDAKADEQGKLFRPGLVAAKWGQYLPTIIGLVDQNQVTVIGISQLRSTLSTMSGNADTDTTMGGQGWKFYSSLRISLYPLKNKATKIFNPLTNGWDESTTSNSICTKLDKCKVSSAAHSRATFHITYGEGIDDLRSLIDIADKNKIVNLNGAWYSWTRSNGTEMKCCGMQAFKQEIMKTKGAEKELKDAVWAALIACPEQELETDKETLSDEDLITAVASIGNS